MKKTKNLHIAVIQQSPDIGGAETYMKELIKMFLAKGHKVSFASNNGKYFEYMEELRIQKYTLPFILDITGNVRGFIKSILFLPYALVFYANLLNNLRKQKTDVIVMSAFSEKLLVTFLTKLIHIPVVWIEYGILYPLFNRNLYIPKVLYRVLKDTPEYVITSSEYTKQSLMRDARISQAKIKLIPCGVSSPKKKTSKVAADLPKNAFIIGNVSRATREKGQEYLIKAMPYIIKKVPNAHLLLIGEGPDKDYFESLIIDLKLKKKVTVLGFVKDIGPYYDVMDIFVFPTIWKLEGFGLVVPEAMMHELPVVGSNIGPVPEVIDKNKTGILVSPKNEKEIAQAVLKLASDKSLRQSFGKAGYKRALQTYDIRKVSGKVLDVLSAARR